MRQHLNLAEQLDAIFEDIVPDAVKIGMVSSKELICVITDQLRHYRAKNIVVDPVMVATASSCLIKTVVLLSKRKVHIAL